MQWIKFFGELNRADADIAGGKGASLGEMTQAGISVPPGFVVLSSAFDRFCDETDLGIEMDAILHTVKSNEIHTCEYASEQIQALILSAKMPESVEQEINASFKTLGVEYVAVRSSATAEDSLSAAWAGQLESYLNTTEKDLIENIKRCWASLFTPRAIFYRFEKELHDQKISVAVVIQKMVESEVSGIAFSVHPVTQNRDQLIIEAGYGLGEAIVSGQITPNSYVVKKSSRRIIDKNISNQGKGLYRVLGGGSEWRTISAALGNQPVLSDERIIELSGIILRIEEHYGFPCDIEWAYEQGEFHVVQSRPITTLTEGDGLSRLLRAVRSGNEKFQKQLVYSFTPIICFESSMHCYVDNPLCAKLRMHAYPKFIVIWNRNYEGWSTGNIQHITDAEQIAYVIDESRAMIKKYADIVGRYQNLEFDVVSNSEIARLLEAINRMTIEIYQRYIFFIDEYFDTADQDLLALLPKVRLELSEFVDKIYGVCNTIITELANRFPTVSWFVFVHMTFAEIIAFLTDQGTSTDESFETLEHRAISYVFDGERLSVIKGEKVNDVARTLSEQEDRERRKLDTAKEITGMAVFKGNVAGEVVMVLDEHYQDVGTLIKDKGEFVLVTPMTRPEFTPFLKNAIAIVTDEGGITCHAAIIARELKIPCITGTKVATSLLHDGDRVEVDADNGIVRILSK